MVWTPILANVANISLASKETCQEDKSTFILLEIFLSVCNVHKCYSQSVQVWGWSQFNNDDKADTGETGTLKWPTMKSTSGLVMLFNNIFLLFSQGFPFTGIHIDYNL